MNKFNRHKAVMSTRVIFFLIWIIIAQSPSVDCILLKRNFGPSPSATHSVLLPAIASSLRQAPGSLPHSIFPSFENSSMHSKSLHKELRHSNYQSLNTELSAASFREDSQLSNHTARVPVGQSTQFDIQC